MTNPHAPPVAAQPPSLARGATFALAVLFSMNLLNYVDRYVFAAVGPGIMKGLALSPKSFGILGSSFMVVYTIVAPLVGWMGDRYSRRLILSFGVGLWSVATVGTAFAASYNQMFLARALLGVGEASYGVIAPTLLADLFAIQLRGRVMGLFYLAMPLGTAIGYGVGGAIEKLATDKAASILAGTRNLGLAFLGPHMVGWRAAFWVVGIPGLLLALGGLMIRDPGRGASEGAPASGKAAKPGLGDYLVLLRTRSFLLNTAGMAAVTFTIGAYGHWMPSFFQLVHKFRPDQNLLFGIPLAVAGLVGVGLGMWLPDRLGRITPRAYLIWAGSAVLLAIPFGCLGLLAENAYAAIALLFGASVLLTSCLGPCNTVTANVIPSNRRAAGYAMSIFLLHLFGDIPSPPVIGDLAGKLASPALRATRPVAFLESLGARPIEAAEAAGNAVVASGHPLEGPTNLTAGMLVIIPVLVIGAFCFLLGSRYLPADQERARAAGGDAADAGISMH